MITLGKSMIKYERLTDSTPEITNLNKILEDNAGNRFFVNWYYSNEQGLDEFWVLGQLIEYLTLNNKWIGVLTIFYLPFGRQDKEPGTPFSGRQMFLKQLKTLLENPFTKTKIVVKEPHSTLNDPDIQEEFFDEVYWDDYDVVVFPDEGAKNRYTSLVYPGISVVSAKKTRLDDRVLIELPEDFDFTNKTVLIYDDICDAGRTFAALGKLLKDRGANNITLLVAYGIFSHKAIENLEQNGIDHIGAVYWLNKTLEKVYSYESIITY